MADHAPPDRVRMVLADQPGHDEPVFAGPRRRRWVVVGAVVTLAVVTAVAWARGSDPVPVRVVEPISGSVQAVPDAPSGSIVARWDRTLPRDHELVGLAVVDDVVVVASRPRRGFGGEGVTTVVGLARTDGAVAWRRVADRAGGQVAVVGADDVALLSTDGSLGLATRTSTVSAPGAGERLVVLDAADGRVRWSVALDRDFSWVHTRADRDSLVVTGRDDVRELAARSGDVRLSFPHVGFPGGQRRASLEDDTWVVPTGSGWDLVRSDGTVERHVDTDVRPEVTADQFLTASGSTVTAHRRADGTTAWRSRLAHPVDTLSATAGPGGPDRSLLADLADPPAADVAVVAHERTPRGADPRITGLTAEGRAVDLSDDPPRVQTTWLTIGQALVGLCVPTAERPDIGQRTCPDAVTLEAFDGSLLAGRDDLDLFRTLPAGMLATRPGVVVVGRDELTLLGWDDLATRWSIPNDGRGPIPAAVSATGSGVAVGWDQPVPATIAWYG